MPGILGGHGWLQCHLETVIAAIALLPGGMESVGRTGETLLLQSLQAVAALECKSLGAGTQLCSRKSNEGKGALFSFHNVLET